MGQSPSIPGNRISKELLQIKINPPPPPPPLSARVPRFQPCLACFQADDRPGTHSNPAHGTHTVRRKLLSRGIHCHQPHLRPWQRCNADAGPDRPGADLCSLDGKRCGSCHAGFLAAHHGVPMCPRGRMHWSCSCDSPCRAPERPVLHEAQLQTSSMRKDSLLGSGESPCLVLVAPPNTLVLIISL